MALTTGLSLQTTIGGRDLEVWHIKGDASTTTFNPRLACVDHVWYQDITGASNDIRLSISAGIITYASAPHAAWHWLFIIGSA